MADKETYGVPLSYDSSINRGSKDKAYRAAEALLKLLTLSEEDFSPIGENAYAFYQTGNDSVPIFQHPVVTDDGKVFIDARPYLTAQGVIKNKNDYLFLQRRAITELYWAKNPDEFAGQEGFVADVFGSWFANGVGSRLNLPMQVSLELRILATIYYLAIMQRGMEYKSQDDFVFAMLKVLPRIMRVPSQPINDFFVGREESIMRLFNTTAVNKSAPMEGLNFAITENIDENYGVNKASVYASLTRGSFVAANAPELVATAMELPPLFMLMLEYSLSKGFYGKTSLGRTTLSLSKRHNVRRFEEFMRLIQVGDE